MTASRTYQIATKDLKRLHCALEQFNTQKMNCRRAGGGLQNEALCDNCQHGANLLQSLADALSMREAGLDVIFTTQMESVENESAKGMVH